ncbi:Mitochondrial metalloendopeptidase OMA1 [Candida viswanathii]|uniref:Mitochondrial metalloendopeptidase OMA1 n=1 Tax=Candida viswanathii TaxID=5486 RepID=A0A367XQY8_9ASCO|nr:Mitochondrial metalloendopeptidase OMA1 [Candida viswanathii]
MFRSRLYFHPWLKRTYATYKRFDNTSSSFTTSYAHLLTSRKALYVGGGLLGSTSTTSTQPPTRAIYNQFKLMILPHSNPLYSRVSNIMNKLLTVALTDNINDDLNQKFLKHLKACIGRSTSSRTTKRRRVSHCVSHELSHQLAQHSSEQLLKQPIYLVLSTILYSITGITWFNDLLINGVLMMPASREMESEADHIGCELLARACFNPEESIRFWERMSQAEQRLSGRVPATQMLEFFSTHPATSRRIADIQKWMPQLLQIRESAGCYDYGRFHNFNQSYFKRS